MSYVLLIDGSYISWLFAQDVHYVWDGQATRSTFIYPKWAMCFILVILVSYGYLPKMSYVLHMDLSNSQWLFTQRLSCVLYSDVSISRWLFTQRLSLVLQMDMSISRAVCSTWISFVVHRYICRYELCAPYGRVSYPTRKTLSSTKTGLITHMRWAGVP